MVSEPVPQEDFHIHPQLQQDTYLIGRLPLCQVLMMDDRRFPWLVLVPTRMGARELTDLSAQEAAILMEETRLAMSVLAAVAEPDKLNVAALGNMVEQLHVHIIARFHSDAAWPNPVWVIGGEDHFPPHTAQILLDKLRDAFAGRTGDWRAAHP